MKTTIKVTTVVKRVVTKELSGRTRVIASDFSTQYFSSNEMLERKSEIRSQFAPEYEEQVWNVTLEQVWEVTKRWLKPEEMKLVTTREIDRVLVNKKPI